jgi:outer membrane protein assembly factor BamA
MLEFDWLDSPLLPMEGWLIQTIYEKTFDAFETDGLFFKVYRYQPTFLNQRVLARGFFGVRSGSLAFQHLMDIGGVGTLRGFRDNSQWGQNLYMININYLFGGDILQRIPLQFIPFYDQLSMGIFVDAGSAWSALAVKESLFDNLGDAETLIDAGLSLLIADGLCRFDFARQIDGGDGDWRITMRLLSSF